MLSRPLLSGVGGSLVDLTLVFVDELVHLPTLFSENLISHLFHRLSVNKRELEKVLKKSNENWC